MSANLSTNPQKITNRFQELIQALQSGDLAGAQQAYSALSQQTPGNTPISSSSSKGMTLQQEFGAIGKALQSGDLKGAQDAFAKLQQDIQSSGRAHGRHHKRWLEPLATAGNSATANAASSLVANSRLATGRIDTTA
jgi:thioredoxin-like negative regulator of GroEL